MSDFILSLPPTFLTDALVIVGTLLVLGAFASVTILD